jgi:hypothetical protein
MGMEGSDQSQWFILREMTILTVAVMRYLGYETTSFNSDTAYQYTRADLTWQGSLLVIYNGKGMFGLVFNGCIGLKTTILTDAVMHYLGYETTSFNSDTAYQSTMDDPTWPGSLIVICNGKGGFGSVFNGYRIGLEMTILTDAVMQYLGYETTSLNSNCIPIHKAWSDMIRLIISDIPY